MLLGLQSAIVVAQFNLVEGLGLVEFQTVQSAHLVRVSVFLGGPGRAVPVLAAGGVTAN